MKHTSRLLFSPTAMRLLRTVALARACVFAAAFAIAAGPPNILFAIADDWGVHASADGTPWIKTPRFDRIARDGLLFKNTYTPNAKCAPSRACILTGRNSWQLGEAANHICYFPAKFKGWGEALAEHGWFVGHTTKGWAPGVANDASGKPQLAGNLDASLEGYMPGGGSLTAGVFKRHVRDYIANTTLQVGSGTDNGFQGDYVGYQLGTASNIGSYIFAVSN